MFLNEIAYNILSAEKKVGDARKQGEATVKRGLYEVPTDISSIMSNRDRTYLEYELAKHIYGQKDGPKDFGEVIAAAKKEMDKLLKETAQAFPEFAPAKGRPR